MAKDAYIKLKVHAGGAYLVVYPAEYGGKDFTTFEEIDTYLDLVMPGKYDKNALHQELQKPSVQVREFLLTKETLRPIDEKVIVKIAPDRLSAKGYFYAPTQGGSLLTREMIVSEMVKTGIKYGVSENNIAKFLENRTYDEPIIIAEATKQQEGKDAFITYFFNTDLTQKPRVNEDGSVDFHHLDLLSAVSKGQLIAELTPAVQGKPGIDVCGGLLRPVKVKPKMLRVGNNIKVSEDGLKAYSEVDGHATVEGEQIFVSNQYEVAANVDASTGDIEYDGNILIHGNVNTGYVVTAKGDIVVEGVVEGAVLTAGGHIILKRGIQGMEHRGVLKATGNIISRFIESATVEAGGYVSADAIMHSKVIAKGDVTVDGKKGYITGGMIRSGTVISARTIGSSMGTTTNLEVGIEPAIIEEYRTLTKEQDDLQEELEIVMQKLMTFAKRIKLGEKLSPDKMLQFKVTSDNREVMKKRDEEITERLKVLKEKIDSYVGGCVRVKGTIYSGTKITISNSVYYVKKDASYARYIREDGEVKIENYY